jgi:hypothetical protein
MKCVVPTAKATKAGSFSDGLFALVSCTASHFSKSMYGWSSFGCWNCMYGSWSLNVIASLRRQMRLSQMANATRSAQHISKRANSIADSSAAPFYSYL